MRASSMFKRKSYLLPALLLPLFLLAGAMLPSGENSKKRMAGPRLASPEQESRALLAEFCDRHWGEWREDLGFCRFEQIHHLNFSHSGSSLVGTGVVIAANDTLRFEWSGSPEIRIGDSAYESRRELVARSAGQLSFGSAGSANPFTVHRVYIERCFVAKGHALELAVCPKPI